MVINVLFCSLPSLLLSPKFARIAVLLFQILIASVTTVDVSEVLIGVNTTCVRKASHNAGNKEEETLLGQDEVSSTDQKDQVDQLHRSYERRRG